MFYAIVGYYSDGSGEPRVLFVTNQKECAEGMLFMLQEAECSMLTSIVEVACSRVFVNAVEVK